MVNICSIFNEPYEGFGNNAWPFEGRCSDEANDIYVIPARIMGITDELVKKCGKEAVCNYIDVINGREPYFKIK